MKKILRFLLILIVILLVGYLILCATAPAEMVAEKSTTINAPKEIVWNQVVNLKNWDNWSPWKESDSTVTTITTEPDGQVGTKYSYDSKKSGSGSMTITGIEGSTMNYDMHFVEPFEADAKGWVKLEDDNGATKVTHHYAGPTVFWMRGMVTLFGKKMLEMSFARGLEMLKEYTESGKAGAPAPAVTEATFPATTFATIRKTIAFAEMDSFFAKAYADLGAAAGSMITGNAHSITYKWDEANGQADVAAAFPVSGPVKGMAMVSIPETKGYMLKYVGPYSGLYGAHMTISQKLAEQKFPFGVAIEEYEKMAPDEPDTNKYVTNIYYLPGQ